MSYAISLPFMLVSFVRDVWTAGLLTFLAVLTYWSTNEVPLQFLVAASHRIASHRIASSCCCSLYQYPSKCGFKLGYLHSDACSALSLICCCSFAGCQGSGRVSLHPLLYLMLWLACTVCVCFVLVMIMQSSTRTLSAALCSPFVYSPNDLPTARLQYLFNERLLQNAAGIIHDKVGSPHQHVSALACRAQRVMALCTS